MDGPCRGVLIPGIDHHVGASRWLRPLPRGIAESRAPRIESEKISANGIEPLTT